LLMSLKDVATLKGLNIDWRPSQFLLKDLHHTTLCLLAYDIWLQHRLSSSMDCTAPWNFLEVF
jgi:hypothetical protein